MVPVGGALARRTRKDFSRRRPKPSTSATTARSTSSTTTKNRLANTTISSTSPVVTSVSRRVGQTTFEASGAHLLDEFERVGHVRSGPFRSDLATVGGAARQKNSRRGASRRRATASLI